MLDWSLAPSLPCTGMNITTALMLAIGIDRYFCLKYPLRYRQWSKKIYVSLVMLTCVVYDLSLKFVGYLTLSDHKVICLISAAYYGRGKDYWVFSQVTINFLVLVVYVRIKREMKSLTASIQNSHMMNIMYSLYIIVGFYIFGWFMTMCGCGVVRLITTEPNFTVTAELSVGVFANINMAIPAFVYFTRSVEYKGALKRLMGRNAVGASETMSIVNWYLTPSVAFSIQKYAAAYLFVTVFIGLFSNGSIVLVTLKSQHLRGPCNILIAIQALMDIVTSLGHIVYFYFLYSRTLIPFSECYFYQFVPTSAMNITTALTLAIGVDRLLSLKYPLLYKMWSIKIYLTLMLLSCVLYDVLIKLIAYMTLTDDLVICLIADGYVGLGKDTWVFTQVIINVAVVLVYRKIQQEMAVLRNSVKEARIIILSLYTIVVAYIFGWLMTMCLLGVVRVLTTEPNLVVTCELFAGLFANLNMVIPAFIYYYRSSMYNMAFRGVFRKAEVTPLSGSHAGSTQARTSIH